MKRRLCAFLALILLLGLTTGAYAAGEHPAAASEEALFSAERTANGIRISAETLPEAERTVAAVYQQDGKMICATEVERGKQTLNLTLICDCAKAAYAKLFFLTRNGRPAGCALTAEITAPEPAEVLAIEANGHIFYADFEDNSSAEALREKLGGGGIEVRMHDYGHFEKVGALPWTLPRNDTSITTEPGDVILYQGDQITVYYDKNTWSFTRLAKIGNVSREDLLNVFGEGDVTVELRLEQRE